MSLTSLSALASVSGFVKGNPSVAVPAGAVAQRDGDYILDRAGSYIEVRA